MSLIFDTAWSKALLDHPGVTAIATEEFQQDCLAALRRNDGYIAQYLGAVENSPT